ncbi:3-hydroxyisobutyrate dehydrogenase [Culex quinquefasciatus]|uniref:3-hydroxyisobutyrate dehydrogenase n=1 Tax=Culex quinquefasciatus TaxID=7176 RepID=B0X9R9_CULQU|nr:3-hydroxyisobutyrate dehydrogenase [Culex quinquefasciatus]|eukprot:XP_001866391.1 3-hydroxyisobutyrate dehydrogenase [Culex quinquefasciatus]
MFAIKKNLPVRYIFFFDTDISRPASRRRSSREDFIANPENSAHLLTGEPSRNGPRVQQAAENDKSENGQEDESVNNTTTKSALETVKRRGRFSLPPYVIQYSDEFLLEEFIRAGHCKKKSAAKKKKFLILDVVVGRFDAQGQGHRGHCKRKLNDSGNVSTLDLDIVSPVPFLRNGGASCHARNRHASVLNALQSHNIQASNIKFRLFGLGIMCYGIVKNLQPEPEFGNCGIMSANLRPEMTGVDQERRRTSPKRSSPKKANSKLQEPNQGGHDDHPGRRRAVAVEECQTFFEAISCNSFYLGEVGDVTKRNLLLQMMIYSVTLAGIAVCQCFNSGIDMPSSPATSSNVSSRLAKRGG